MVTRAASKSIRSIALNGDCAVYRCVQCGSVFRHEMPRNLSCPCGSIGVEWVNYEAWRAEHPIVICQDHGITIGTRGFGEPIECNLCKAVP